MEQAKPQSLMQAVATGTIAPLTKNKTMRNHQFPGRSVVMTADAMAATSQPVATQVALDTLRDGGNALDAAIAASAALSVVESYSTGFGGDCFILYHEAKTGKLHAINGSGRSPAAATIEAMNERGHTEMPERGILTVTVPGAVDAWQSANRKLGQLEFSALMEAAIHYAENGYAVTPVIQKNWHDQEALMAETPEASAAYLVDGVTPAAGTIHRQPDLAESIKMIARDGADALYRGELARQIASYCEANDGFLTYDDLANHRTAWVDPVKGHYRGYDVYEIPPNGQGITVLMALNILSQVDMSTIQHLSADHIHLISSAFSIAMAERDRFVADPDFAEIPVDHLLSSEFAQQQFARIDMNRALQQPVTSAMPHHKDTVYLTVVDKDRNACSIINSIFHSFGSGLVAGSTGINLQNRGAGFSLQPGHFNQLEPNKRPMHTIIPAMVYRDNRPVLSFGVMGGQYQAMGQTYVLSNWIDYGMDIQQALDAPRFFIYGEDLELEQTIPADIANQLRNKGHSVVTAESPHGGGQGIIINWETGVLQGGSDPRKDGCAGGF